MWGGDIYILLRVQFTELKSVTTFKSNNFKNILQKKKGFEFSKNISDMKTYTQDYKTILN